MDPCDSTDEKNLSDFYLFALLDLQRNGGTVCDLSTSEKFSIHSNESLV